MPSADEIREQTASELDRRRRLAVPAFAGGLLYLLSSIVISSTLNGAPTVGLLQGLSPALSGVASPSVSPRTEEVKFISRHALPLIAGSLLAAIAIGALLLILMLLIDATSFRRPVWKAARPLALYGGIAVIVVSVGHQVVSAIQTHNFAVGSDHSNNAVEQALTKGAANMIVQYVDLLAGLALAAGMIATMMAAQRVGLLPRWMGILGIFTGLLIFLPIGGAQLQVIPAFWMVMIGILFVGRWPSGDPPAWAAGEARPWPSAAEQRAARQAAAGGAKAQPAAAGAAAPGAPEPARPASSGSSRKRRRKGRGGRR
jgi:hypothetical protein